MIGGILAGETDWKILAIDIKDPLAEKLNGEPLILPLMLHFKDLVVHIPSIQILPTSTEKCLVLSK